MPIYEFRCMKCNHCFEFLVRGSDDMVELTCEQCASSELERVVSKTNFVVTGGGSGPSAASSTTRSCSSGSCTTYDIPGPR